MAHAHHFLSRLDRVSLPHVELALGLYNDAPLLRFILESVRLPERAERVAVSLDHPEDGPFLIVTRDGRFVTCLGAGMSPGEHPVITRGQLDAVAAKGGALRARINESLRFAGARGGVGKLLRRIHEAGDDLSREEIVALGGLQPLYAFEFFQFIFSASSDLRDARKLLLPHLRRSERLKPQFTDSLRSYWNTLWSIGHFSVLSAMDGWASIERWPAAAVALVPTAPFSWPAVREGLTALALKGIWGVGRIGKPLLAGCKQRYRQANSPFSIVDGGMSLGVIGLRHTKLHAEVAKVLAAGPDVDPAKHVAGEFVHSLNRALGHIIDPAEVVPADFTILHRGLGARYWVERTKHLPPGAPLRFERAEDVPEDLALCAAVNEPIEYIDRSTNAIAMFMMLPWLSRATPEQLYLPREAIKARSVPWEPEHTLAHLRLHRDNFLTELRAPRRRLATGRHAVAASPRAGTPSPPSPRPPPSHAG